MARFFTSDLHFFHRMMIFRRGFKSAEEMHESIIHTWNKRISKNDQVFILGDFSFGKKQETLDIVKRLNGKKTLIRGNHDERFKNQDLIEMGFDVRDQLIIGTIEPTLLSHYPYRSFIDQFKHLTSPRKYSHLKPGYSGLQLIHGHYHSGPKSTYRAVNVAWDIHLKPLEEKEVVALFSKREKIKDFIKILGL